MFRAFFTAIIVFSTISSVVAQAIYDLHGRIYSTPDEKSIDIQYLIINNEFLLKEIRQFIKEQRDSSVVFHKGFGFIKVSQFREFPNKARLLSDLDKDSKDTVYQFFISADSYLLTTNFSKTAAYCQSCFPTYYSLVDDRLILFESPVTQWLSGGVYSEKSKRKVADLVRRCLTQSLETSFVFYNFPDRMPYTLTTEQRKSMSEQEIMENAWFVLNSGKRVILHFDGSVSYIY